MASELIAGLGLFKTMFDLAKGLKDVADTVTRNGIAIQLQEQILAAQAEQTSLIQGKADLEKEVAHLKAWDADRENYELRPMNSGEYPPMARALKTEHSSAKPSHWLCADCFERRQKRHLQPETRDVGRALVYVCQECGSELYVVGVRHSAHSKPRTTAGHR